MVDRDRELSAEEDIAILSEKKGDWYERLLAKYKHMLVGLARKYYLVGGGDASDLVQEAMYAFYRSALSFEEGKNASFKTYAAVCVRNHLTDVMRRNLGAANVFNRVSAQLEFEDGEEGRSERAAEYYPDPLTNYLREESDRALSARTEALLSSRQREVLSMYIDGYSYGEIADKLGIDEKAVDNALAAARNKLRKHFSSKKEDK